MAGTSRLPSPPSFASWLSFFVSGLILLPAFWPHERQRDTRFRSSAGPPRRLSFIEGHVRCSFPEDLRLSRARAWVSGEACCRASGAKGTPGGAAGCLRGPGVSTQAKRQLCERAGSQHLSLPWYSKHPRRLHSLLRQGPVSAL